MSSGNSAKSNRAQGNLSRVVRINKLNKTSGRGKEAPSERDCATTTSTRNEFDLFSKLISSVFRYGATEARVRFVLGDVDSRFFVYLGPGSGGIIPGEVPRTLYVPSKLNKEERPTSFFYSRNMRE